MEIFNDGVIFLMIVAVILNGFIKMCFREGVKGGKLLHTNVCAMCGKGVVVSQSSIIEVMIGLVFIYILLSLLVSQINTMVAFTLNIRAEQLRKRVEAIIFDEGTRKHLLAHPIVSMVKFPEKNQSFASVPLENLETSNVSKLAPATFAKAMINILSDPFLALYSALTTVENDDDREVLTAIVNQLKANLNSPTKANAALSQLHEMVVALEPADREDRKAILRTLSPLQTSIRNIQSGNSGLLMILDGVSRVENRAFQQAMETVLSSVQSVNEAQIAIENWYDRRLSQTNDMYGCTMQYFSLGVGLLLAVLLNIDSLYIAQTLWNDPALRQSVVLAAQATEYNAIALEVAPILDESGQPIPITSEDAIQGATTSLLNARATLDQLLELRLPIGWNFRLEGWTADDSSESVIQVYDPAKDTRNIANLIPGMSKGWFINLITKMGGLLITAIAVAQGAPFWFDILRRLSGKTSASVSEDPKVA